MKPYYSLVQHKGESRIQVKFERNDVWNRRMQQVPGAKWSKTLTCWHIPDTAENRRKCGLKAKETNTVTPFIKLRDKTVSSKDAPHPISLNNKKEFERFLHILELKAYSPSTIKTYRNEFLQLLQLLNEVPVQGLSSNDLQRYFLHCMQHGLSENSINSRINAIKFYYEQVLLKDRMFFEIPRPKKHLQLPKLLNEEELKKLFNALVNKKHKAMLFTAYSAGLRVSEIANLKLQHIDSTSMQIFIERSKGKKDRYVNLSPVLLDILRNYIRAYTHKPTVYLFESEQSGTAYPRERYSRYL